MDFGSREQQWRLTKQDLEQILSTAIADYRLARVPGREDEMSVLLTLLTGKQLRLVAKTLLDEGSGRLRRSLVLRREMDAYLLVLPECRRIQEERGVGPRERLNMFCACAGARDSRLHDDDGGGGLAGEDSVLLLEDLRAQGYVPGGDVPELGLGETEFVVTQLARFHATAVAVKLVKPLVFRNMVVRVLGHPQVTRRCTSRMNSCIEVLRQMEEFSDHVGMITKLFDDDAGEPNPLPSLQFATVIHNDVRKANMMFKYRDDAQRKIASIKIVNFGDACYGSPVSDLLLFLFTSTEIKVVVEHFDSLFRLYHTVFVDWLGKMKCDAQNFTFENFSKELGIFAARELPRIISCLIPVDNNRKLTVSSKQYLPRDSYFIRKVDSFIKRTLQIIEIFDKREWI